MNRGRRKRLIAFALISLYAVRSLTAEDTVEIQADNYGTFDDVKGMATFEGNVSAKMLSTGATLRSRRLELYLDPVSRKPIQAKAKGHVILTEESGRIFCDLALFKRSDTSIELSGNVKVRTPPLKLDGDRAYYNYRSGQGRITALPEQQVTFTIERSQSQNSNEAGRPAGEKMGQPWLITGRSNRIIVHKNSKRAILQGKVAVEDTSNRSEMFADQIELFFDSLDEIKEAIATGQFSLAQDGKYAKADRAVFDYQSEIVTLHGNALVAEPGRGIVTSSTIEMHMKESKGELRSDGKKPIKTVITIE